MGVVIKYNRFFKVEREFLCFHPEGEIFFFFLLPFPTALCLYLCRQVKISIFTVCMGIDGCVFSLFYFGPLVASRPKSSILLK